MISNLAVAQKDFPAAATTSEGLRFLVNFAALAPSGHNTQPWLFAIDDHGLTLIADRIRALPVVDPYDRALVISCGAALEHLVIAARHFGQEHAVEVLPNGEPDHLASIRLTGKVAPTVLDTELFEAMPLRRTTRTKHGFRNLPEGLQHACRELASDLGIELTLVIDESKRAQIADLVAQGDRTQFADPRFRRALAAWIYSRRSASHDGMSGASFGMPDVLSPVSAVVIRTFDMGKGGSGKRSGESPAWITATRRLCHTRRSPGRLDCGRTRARPSALEAYGFGCDGRISRSTSGSRGTSSSSQGYNRLGVQSAAVDAVWVRTEGSPDSATTDRRSAPIALEADTRRQK